MASNPVRDEKGRFVEVDPPLVAVTVNNPVTTLKKWWKKVMDNEGVDFRLTIHPLTAIAIASIIGIGSFSLGRITLPKDNPIVQYLPQLATEPTPNPWRETAFSGILRHTEYSDTYYLQTEKAEAITLLVPQSVKLSPLVGKRIFASGKFNTTTGVLVVTEATHLELLPIRVTYLPGVSPKPSPFPTPIEEPSPTPLPDPTPAETTQEITN